MVGPESSLCMEVAFVGRSFIVKNITAVILPGGLCSEVAFIGRWLSWRFDCNSKAHKVYVILIDE